MVQEADFDSRLWPETEEKPNYPLLWLVAYLGFKIPINDLRFKCVHVRLEIMVNC